MSEPLSVDPAVLMREAANFERISDGLRNELARVESIATNMGSHWQGGAAGSARDAIQRFHEASNAQIQTLNHISGNVQIAGARYAETDDERARALASQMGMGEPADEHGEEPKNRKVQLVDDHRPLHPGEPVPRDPTPASRLPPPLQPGANDDPWTHGGDRRWTSVATEGIKEKAVALAGLEMERNGQTTSQQMLDHYLGNSGTPRALRPEQVDSWLSNTGTDYAGVSPPTKVVGDNLDAVTRNAFDTAQRTGAPVTLSGNTPGSAQPEAMATPLGRWAATPSPRHTT